MARPPHPDADLVAELCQRLLPLGVVHSRAMFGGHGLFRDGLMFIIVAAGRVYLKADTQTRGDFEAADCEPFKPFAHKPMTMSYWEVPADVRADTDRFITWSKAACAAAQRAHEAKPARRRRPGRPRPRPRRAQG